MIPSSVPTMRQARMPRSIGLAATRNLCGEAATIRQISQRNRPMTDVPAHPSFSKIPQPLWIPTTAATGEDERPSFQHLWCEALPDQLSVHDPVSWGAPLMLQVENETQFRVKIDEPPTPRGKQKNSDFYANVGDAIRTLREDIPLLFEREFDYGIYREDIVFRDPQLVFKGMKNYQLIIWSLRFHGRLFFSKLTVDVLRIWQPEDHLIKMRWRIYGVPRVWWKAEGVIDGISTYKLDSDGMVYEHFVDNVQLRDPPITNPFLYGLNYVLAPRLQGQNQMPVPGSWFTGSVGEELSSQTVIEQ